MAAKKKASAKKSEAPKLKVVEGEKATEPMTKPAGKLANQEYRIAALAELKQHPKNPKKGDVEAIGESIEENGFYGTVLAQKSTGYILAGNHKVKAAAAHGIVELPVMFIDCDDATAERILLADNKIAALGSFDDRIVMSILEDQKKRTGSLRGTGYSDDDLAKMTAKHGPPDAFPVFDDHVKVTYKCPSCGFAWQ